MIGLISNQLIIFWLSRNSSVSKAPGLATMVARAALENHCTEISKSTGHCFLV